MMPTAELVMVDGSGGTSGENVIGDSADSISSAIEKEEEMQSLSFLSDNEIQLISDFLNGDTSLPPPPGPVDGAASYDANCGSCHGFGTNTTKAGATVTRINDGIVNVSSMNSLSSLSAVEIQSIADFLATIAPPSTPQGLYATYCGACHGADGSGGTSGEKVIGDSASKISSAIEKEEEMQSLSFLSDNEIQLISDFLNGDTSTPPPPGPVDGAASYDANCGACHGFGTNSTKAGATVTRINNGITGEPSMASLSNLSAAEIQAIADFLASIVAPPPPPPPPGPIDGAASSDANCGSCHGFGTTSTKAGATVTRINDGIVAVPSMNSLSSLSAAEIQAIADFLASIVAPPPPPPPPGPVDGAASYDANCGSCHGFGTSSTKAGATVTRINDGIVAVPSMNSLSSLSATEIQAIADFLMSLAPPSTPEGLYAAHCGSCHGADGSGGTSGVNVIGDSASKISNEIAAVQEMQSLSFLTDSEIQLISDFLNGITTPPPGSIDGLALYDINCAGCHGPSSNSEKVGATAARINSGIINEPSMFFFSTALTAAEVQAIADFLVSVAPPPPVGSDGAALYTINCAGCHGPGDNSAKAGATVARINSGISSASSMNFLSSVLTAADIQAIADFLATTPPPGTPEAKYLTYCSSCHGADGRSGSGGNVTGDSAEDIEDAIDKEEEMQSLSFLSSSDISDIADYLDVLKQQEAQLEHSWYSSRWH
jgi:mono/diheme cytochrome c family protein